MPSRRRSPSPSERGVRAFAALAAILLAAAACAPGGAAPASPATAAAPVATARSGPAFDHKAHIERGLECTDCHEGAEEKADAGMPSVEGCMECHEEIDAEKPAEKRVEAFLDPATKKPRWSAFAKQADEVRFAHAPHAAAKVECSSCHRGIEESTRTGPELRLTMDECMACHAERKASNACATCHSEIGADRAPKSHDRLWNVRHGQWVRRGAAPQTRADDCKLCHTESTCVDCHRSEPPRSHTEHWRLGPGHGLAAALDRDACRTCHASDACVACHTTNPPRSHRGAWGSPRNRHCLGCHETTRSAGEDGCFTCHDGTPSHRLAPAKPSDHRPDWECLLCHQDDLRHPIPDQSCNSCHR